MGLMSLFGKGPLSAGKIDKIAKLAANPFAQPDVRMREMQRLLSDGTPAALRGVLKRFAANASGHIADEDEKKWLEDQLVDIGDDSLEPLADFIGAEEQISYALHAYRRIAGDQATVGFLLGVLEKYGPDDYRSSEAKVQIIGELAHLVADPRVLPGLVPFLRDHSDEVRWAVIELVEAAAREGRLTPELQAAAAKELGAMILSDDNRPRIERRAAEILCEREWPVGGTGESLPTLLEDEFFLDKKRFVRRRAKKKTE
jgi:hypothetical protein